MKSKFLMDVSDAQLVRVGLFSYLFVCQQPQAGCLKLFAEYNALNSEHFRYM